MISGGSLASQIRGGVYHGLKTYWYNPISKRPPEHLPVTCELGNLFELLRLINCNHEAKEVYDATFF